MTLDEAIKRNPYSPKKGNKSAYCRYLRYNVDGWYQLDSKEVYRRWRKVESMTREEIEKLPFNIAILLSESLIVDTKETIYKKLTEVCNLAITALEQEPKYCDRNICIKNEYNGISCDECEVTKSQESCDCISRDEAIQAVREAYSIYIPRMNGWEKGLPLKIDKAIYDLPSVQPKPIECDDCISRKAVLKTLEFCDNALDVDRTVESYKALLTECYKELPSIKPKTGHWIDGHCSECGCDVPAYIIDWKWQKDMDAKYCPNCGIKMESEDV